MLDVLGMPHWKLETEAASISLEKALAVFTEPDALRARRRSHGQRPQGDLGGQQLTFVKPASSSPRTLFIPLKMDMVGMTLAEGVFVSCVCIMTV